ncbi:molecular chaperone DnaK [Alginatibacterium sediminis]|uniref:Molecular chaperone DnaK n=1 Tax=Alginatibacterium sediminis TaxID=2164068 RepID=A0A420E5Y0_9ALTE|nr:TraR/DksA C4-type zinc finger protein [Alginatibacterium sediminis]RKF13203.1 molecular chaperone DnaK [Alginatibacterium sediminis]
MLPTKADCSTMINEQEINVFKQKLLDELNNVTQRLEDHEAVKRDATETGDEVDRANQEESQQLLLNRRQHDLKLMKSLKDALRRIDSDDFGFCESCGDDISMPRLNARPESRYCIDCQDVRERSNGSMR